MPGKDRAYGFEQMSWSDKKVLITGAGGFIGSHLTERLVELGAKTHAFVHYGSTGSWGWLDQSPMKDDVEIVLGDIRDQDTVLHAINGIDVVFHLAALIAIPYSYQAPLSYVRTNVEGTLNVLQAAQRAGSEIVVHTSTSEVYGTARRVPIDENEPLQGQSPYSASKIGADKIAESFHLSFGLPVVTVRPFNTFGPRQSARAVIPTIITQALNGSEIRLGNLDPTRDLSFVADTVEGFIKAAETRKAIGETINLGSGREISIKDLAALILKLMNRDIPIALEGARLRPENSEVDRLCADNRKGKSILGWTPKYSLEEGLTATIGWIRENSERYRTGVYVV
jgi:NAD dependent epimerase/dehydratase